MCLVGYSCLACGGCHQHHKQKENKNDKDQQQQQQQKSSLAKKVECPNSSPNFIFDAVVIGAGDDPQVPMDITELGLLSGRTDHRWPSYEVGNGSSYF